jgi:hypothetical protein
VKLPRACLPESVKLPRTCSGSAMTSSSGRPFQWSESSSMSWYPVRLIISGTTAL